jgi:exoribonuclease-2
MSRLPVLMSRLPVLMGRLPVPVASRQVLTGYEFISQPGKIGLATPAIARRPNSLFAVSLFALRSSRQRLELHTDAHYDAARDTNETIFRGGRMNVNSTQQRDTLQRIARLAMSQRGLFTQSSHAAIAELEKLQAASAQTNDAARDLRDLPWASIDNDDSLDLDQLTVAAAGADGTVKILVAIADVDGLVSKGMAIDLDARHNTTSVYTAAQIFPMLPVRLSTDLTSLSDQADRPAVVIEMTFDSAGTMQASDIYAATVRNRAKLAYNSVAAWLDGQGPMPAPIAKVPGLDENLRTQDRVAQQAKAFRHEHGALDLETIQAQPVFEGDRILDLAVDRKNRAKELIEDFMIAANGVTARYLAAKGFASLRRVVRTPKLWDRIVEVASQYGVRLGATPDAKALSQFLSQRRAADPVRFPDLSLTIVKLLGRGEYVVESPGDAAPGHFGLAVEDYTHSTAPNRRYPDLVTQRLLKAAITGSATPYSRDELAALASHCTQKEDDANKVERQIAKSAAAMLLESRTGEQFDAISTGASPKGTWVRVFQPPVEGKLVQGFEGVKVGDRLRVRLLRSDVEQGFIDFQRV